MKINFKSPKVFIPIIVSVILVISLSIIAIVYKPWEKLSELKKINAELAFVEGTVEYQYQEQGWKTADTNTQLKEGYSVRIIGEGKAIINIDDGSSIRLNSESQVTLESMTAGHIVVTNNKGEVYSRVVPSKRIFEIKSNDVTYKAMGTAYKTVNTEKEQSVEVYHSKVTIIGVNESGEILVEQGNKFYIVDQNNPDNEKKVIPVDPNEVKQDEFVMWNKEQDENVNEFKENMGVLFDLEPPVLNIVSPQNNATTQEATIKVEGTTENGANVRINSEEITVENGYFTKDVALNEGNNSISVISYDSAGNSTVVTLIVIYTKPVVQDPTPTPTPQPTTPSIYLTGTKVDGGISLSWNVKNLTVSNGFKIVYSTSANPTYPENSYAAYISDSSTRKYTWSVKDGKTYHIRVCRYVPDQGKCDFYSNDISVTAPTAQQSSVKSILLSANASTSKVSWSTDGNSASGFKVVWSQVSGPTYPTRSSDQYQYFSNSDANTSNVLDAFGCENPDGCTYYVRVCEYLGGKCGVYSNEVTIVLKNE